MAEHHAKPPSPISQVLQTLGITREDLLRHSENMRQFLTAEDANSLRVLTKEIKEPGSTHLASTRNRSLSRSSSNANASTSRETLRSPTPMTPIKVEPIEAPLSSRHMDNMEMVIERKSRQTKRDRKGRKEKGSVGGVPPSPSPSAAGFSMDSFMQSRDGPRLSTFQVSEPAQSEVTESDFLPVVSVAPVTPQHHKYYRDYTVNDTSTTRSDQDVYHPPSPTPARYRQRTTPNLPAATITPAKIPTPFNFAIPETPKRNNNYYKSPLPASSPPPQSSPFSSPAKRVVNLVSSPGPMGPLPSESDYDELPYTLPPGPYTTKKPDASYAALVGRAILSSPKHALTLQEIYDWITIVHPHFKRGETTWMNSIRHVLSTTACFRKHTRERSAGRTLWAIWDCDLECFKNGGFDKQKCKDMMDLKKLNASSGSGSKKRPVAAVDDIADRKPKKQRRSAIAAIEKEAIETAAAASAALQSTIPPPAGPSSQIHHPVFPTTTRPTPHHQPYYETCVQQQPEVIFPPLPTSSGYQRMASSSSVATSTSYSQQSASSFASSSDHYASEPPSSAATTCESEPPVITSPPPVSCSPRPSESISIPELTPNGSSSSPPLASEDHENNNDMELDELNLVYPPGMDDDERLFSEMLSADALEPGFTLNRHDYYHSLDKGKQRAITPPPKKLTLPPIAPSPSLNRKSKIKSNKTASSKDTSSRQLLFPITVTNSPPARPSTPPRNSSSVSHLQLSPVRTPLSHKGLHMSPSASLAHYKSHLDPPPPVPHSPFQHSETMGIDSENIRTPSRKRTSNLNPAHSSIFPVTPKKLIFPTPNSSQESPFRTPGSRLGLFDPHDTSTLLDEELSRFGGGQDSPGGGLYEGKKGLLYESPSMPSPGKWAKWW